VSFGLGLRRHCYSRVPRGSVIVPAIVCALAAVALAGETGKVAGRVFDRQTGEPLPSANVVVSGLELGAATDLSGYYAILNVPVGPHSVEASMVGYQTVVTENVWVQSDRLTRLDLRLAEAPVEMPRVVTRAEKPVVSKEVVAARYSIRADQMLAMPADRLVDLVFFSSSVVKTDSTLHVRGGRANEVDYLIDGVSVVDPLFGGLGIELSRGVADEVIFMPGGFSAEYGRAMSGVINLITVNPRSALGGRYRLKSEEPMPLYYDFGYTDQGLQLHLPVLPNLRTVFDVGLTTTDDWDPRLFVLPHKSRQDYSLYGKAFYDAGGKVRLALSGAASRTQYDRYQSEWKLRLNDYRSDLNSGNLGVAKLTYMPNSRAYYTLSLSRFENSRKYGVRDSGRVEFWQDFTFRDTSEYSFPVMDIDNPWGCPYESYWFFFTRGTYDDLRRSRSTVLAAKLTANNQLTNAHQLSAGLTGDLYDVSSERVHWPADRPVTDTYRFSPRSLGAYVQDKVEYEGLYADLGLRFDRFNPADSVRPKDGYPEQWNQVAAQQQLSPRLGMSFRITDWLFARANVGYYFQMPLFSMLYDNTVNPVRFRTMHGDSTKLILGNPQLAPERTTAYELGLQGEVAKGLVLTANVWRKDVHDLIGTRDVPALPLSYVTYVNVDFAQLTGVELIVDLANTWLDTKISYTYSRARGSSSYANEGYDRYLSQGDSSVPVKEYVLDFNQPHRAFLQMDVKVPERLFGVRWLDAAMDELGLHLLGYVGNGLPYTPPGGKGAPVVKNSLQGPMRSNLDGLITKGIKFGRVKLNLVAEVMNVLDIRDVLYVYPATGLPNEDGVFIDYADFNRTGALAIRFGDRDYDPRRDFNFDGYLSQYEEYRSTVMYHRATIDWPSHYGPPRRARLGFELNF